MRRQSRYLDRFRLPDSIQDDPNTPEDESQGRAGSSSASQLSYDNQIGDFESYVELLKSVPAYKPNETDLTITALTAFAAAAPPSSPVILSK